MMGSGKSTIGSLLAQRTGWSYHDNDLLLERSLGVNARALLAESGVDAMRRAESDALRLGLAQPEPCIVGAAAGTVLGADSRSALERHALVVWLRTSPRTLAGRAVGAKHRPWLEGDPEGWMRRTLDARRPLYESVADHTVDTDDRSPEATAEDIFAWLRGMAACSAWLRET